MRFGGGAGALASSVVAMAVAACSSASSPPPDAAPATNDCHAWETKDDDGSCRPPGAWTCGVGFASDGSGGCVAKLPLADCAAGEMAVPGDAACKRVGPDEPPVCASGTMAVAGESACREVGDCGTGTWGAIPVDATTQYVDVAYGGGASDGSAAKPWTTIAAGVSAAASGAIVAVAAGTYTEPVALVRRVALWGRCPKMTEVVARGGMPAVRIDAGASASEVHGIALTGDGPGVATSAEGVVVDHVSIHETTGVGVDARAGLSLRASLVEAPHDAGILVTAAAHVLVTDTLVRGVLARADKTNGDGVRADAGSRVELRNVVVEGCRDLALLAHDTDVVVDGSVLRDTMEEEASSLFGFGIEVASVGAGAPARTLSVTNSRVVRNRSGGIVVAGNVTALVASTLVADTRASAADRKAGVGIQAQEDPQAKLTPTLTVRASLVEGNRAVGVNAVAASLALEASVVRGTQPLDASGSDGFGVAVERAHATIRGSLLDENHTAALQVEAADVVVESSLLRRTRTNLATGRQGFGVQVLPLPNAPRAKVSLDGVVLDANHSAGVLVIGSDLVTAQTTIRGTLLDLFNSDSGGGIDAQNDGTSSPSLSMRDSIVVDCRTVGVHVVGGDATLDRIAVRGTRPSASGVGDGIAADCASALRVTRTRVEGSARAGFSSFGASVSLASSSSACNAIALDGESSCGAGHDFAFELAAGNACDCAPPGAPADGGAPPTCQVLSATLSPPKRLEK